MPVRAASALVIHLDDIEEKLSLMTHRRVGGFRA